MDFYLFLLLIYPKCQIWIIEHDGCAFVDILYIFLLIIDSQFL